ncbi:sulfate ABC transporter, periplasmic sulfate-binding protein [Thalassoporum mexicanum PCC 7367]|nr:sulfate ABC transporter, periplasmic sulfate-binding protein [Pseudanabaena sp. PCC 7367]
MWRSQFKGLWLFLVGIIISLTIAACSNSGNSIDPAIQSSQLGHNGTDQITLVAFAASKSAYDEILPLFEQQWHERTGRKVIFSRSFGPSGSQARAVIDGLPADVVHLALSLDVNKIEKEQLINPGWQQELPNGSIVANTALVLAQRNNSSSHRDRPTPSITTWLELVEPDVEIVTANPKTSGAARWFFLAIYGYGLAEFKQPAPALEFVRKFYGNAIVLCRDVREAMTVFSQQGQGDVLISYENELLLAKQKGLDNRFIVPTDINIAIDTPIAAIDANVVKHGNGEVVKAFTEFLFTPTAQRAFAKSGFRPVNQQIKAEFSDKYPVINKMLTVDDFGGWDRIQSEFFADGAEFDQIQASLGDR